MAAHLHHSHGTRQDIKGGRVMAWYADIEKWDGSNIIQISDNSLAAINRRLENNYKEEEISSLYIYQVLGV